MAGRQQPKTAADCFSRLQKLKEDAEQSQFSRRNISPTKRKLLAGVVDDLKDCLRKLRAWREEFDKADQSQRPELLDRPTLDQKTESLFDSIEKAEAALDARLRRQRPQPDETFDARLKRWRQRLEWIIHRNRYRFSDPYRSLLLRSDRLSDRFWKSSFGIPWSRWEKQ